MLTKTGLDFELDLLQKYRKFITQTSCLAYLKSKDTGKIKELSFFPLNFVKIQASNTFSICSKLKVGLLRAWNKNKPINRFD